MSIVWLDRDVLLAIHDAVAAGHGGRAGVADYLALDVVRTRPPSAPRGAELDPVELAAWQAYAILTRKPFRGGNRRVAAVVMETFLALNGRELAALEEDLAVAVLALADGDWTPHDMVDWLNRRVRPVR